jgi:hypothetical protein
MFVEKKIALQKEMLFISLLLIACISPILKNQLIVGSIINATIFLAIFKLNYKKAIICAFFPSLMAIATTAVPAYLVIFVPFIIFANLTLIYTYKITKSINHYLAMVFAVIAKFIIIYSASILFLSLFHLESYLTLFGSIQLVTASIGAVLASIINLKR